MLKKIFLLLTVSIMIFLPSAYANDVTEKNMYKNFFSIKVEGEYIDGDVYYDEKSGDVYIPLRAVFESMGNTVLWNDNTKTVDIVPGTEKNSAYKGERKNTGGIVAQTYNVYPNCVSINYNGTVFEAETFILNNRTYIGFSAFSQFDGHTYGDNATNTIRLYSKNFKELANDVAVYYGNDKTLTFAETLDLIRYLYGDVTVAIKNNFQELDNYLLFNQAVLKIAEELNVTLTEEDLKTFNENNDIDSIIEKTGIEDSKFFNDLVVTDYALRGKLAQLKKAELYNPTDDEVKVWYANAMESKGLWLQAQHILIPKDDKGEGLKEAQRLLTEAKKSTTDFTKLMLAYSQDPGSKSEPNGYIFTEGQMVDSFYQGALNLKVGEISEIVESEYGYHIIKKIAQWDNGIPYEDIKDTVRNSYAEKIFEEKLNEKTTESDVFFLKDSLIKNFSK